jgi:hypothetical protein
MYRAYRGDLEIHQRNLHEQYGPLLRVAPGRCPIRCEIVAYVHACIDEATCDDPREIPTVYPLKAPLEKTVWYDAWRPAGMKSRPDMFTNRSEKDHAAYQRIVVHIYSLTSVLKSEPGLDETVRLFIERLDAFADRGEKFDYGLWLEMFAYDSIGVVFFGKQFGFLKDRVDYGGYIEAVHRSLPLLGILAMSPPYLRPILMAGALTMLKLFKAVIAVGGVYTTAERETLAAQARAEEDSAKQVDMRSQMLRIVRDKGAKNNFGVREIMLENWNAV